MKVVAACVFSLLWLLTVPAWAVTAESVPSGRSEGVQCGKRSIEGVIFDGDSATRQKVEGAARQGHKSLTDLLTQYRTTMPSGVKYLTELDPIRHAKPDGSPTLNSSRVIILFVFDDDKAAPWPTFVQNVNAAVVSPSSQQEVSVSSTSTNVLEIGDNQFPKGSQGSELYVEVNFKPDTQSQCEFANVRLFLWLERRWSWTHGIFSSPVSVSLASVALDFSGSAPTIGVAPVGVLVGPRLNFSPNFYLGFGAATHWLIKPADSGTTGDKLSKLTLGGYLDLGGWMYVEPAYLHSFTEAPRSRFTLMLGAAPEFVKLISGQK